MPIELPDDELETTANPLSKKAEVVLQEASQYEGKFGAARGPGAISVVVLPGRGLMTDTVTIVDHKGTKQVSVYHNSIRGASLNTCHAFLCRQKSHTKSCILSM